MSNGIEARRPLSPHLSIYRPMLTMMMSIAHRITGFANATGFLLLAWWLTAASLGSHAYSYVERFFGSIPGELLLVLYIFSLFHHMLGGIRHLIWDTGHAMDKKSIEVLAAATIVGSITLTVLAFAAAYWLKGAF